MFNIIRTIFKSNLFVDDQFAEAQNNGKTKNKLTDNYLV